MSRIRNVDTTEGPLIGKALQIAWPAVLQAMLVNFYAFNDYVFVGMLSDPTSTAALSACFAILLINYTVLSVFPTGATTLIARAFGARRTERTADIFRQALGTTLLWSVVVGVAGVALLPSLIAMANVTAPVGARASEYLSVIYYATPAFALMLVVVGAFRACGNTRVPLVLEACSLVINTVLNYLLVLGPGPFPQMGIEGAAIATAISRALPGLVGLWLIARGSLGFSLARSPGESRRAVWWPRLEAARGMARIGVFQSISGLFYGLVYLALNRMVGELGPAAQGGLGAGLRGIEWLGFAFGDGFFTASVAIVGQNAGAGKARRAYRGAWSNALLSAAACQLMGFVFILAPDALCALVTDDPATLAYATTYVRLIGWVMWAVGFEMSMFGAIVGSGRTEVGLAISGGSNLLRIPIAVWLLFGGGALLDGIRWTVFGSVEAPAVTGAFPAIVVAIGATAVLKALLYSAYMVWQRDRFAAPVLAGPGR